MIMIVAKLRKLATVGLLVFSVWGAAWATKPIELSLFSPIQLQGESASIKGLRLNLLYVNNARVKGVDIGFGLSRAGQYLGLQTAVIANYVDGSVKGAQTGFFLFAPSFANMAGSMKGVQYAMFFNSANKLTGVQLVGIFNKADKAKGLQLGLINVSNNLHGLQLGLINFAKNGFLPIFPFFNFSF